MSSSNTQDSFHLVWSQDVAETELRASSLSISVRTTSSLQIFRCQGKACCGSGGGNISSTNNVGMQTVKLLAILVPQSLTRGMKKIAEDHKESNKTDSMQQLKDAEVELRKSIHPCLYNNQDKGAPELSVSGVITSSNMPADIVLVSISKNEDHNIRCDEIIFHHSCLLNNDTLSNAPWSVIKAFPIKMLSNNTESYNQTAAILPGCPVCLHRIDPIKLGLPQLKPQHSCSKLCTTNAINNKNGQLHSCRNEILFIPWPPPSHCSICQIIAQRDNLPDISMQQSSLSGFPSSDAPRSTLEIEGVDYKSVSMMCHDCGMTSTLWVCLTCGFIGCGRYTRKHAAQHYNNTRHPYSLELATGRIWDYDNGTFAHRKDLMECPVLSMKWGDIDSPIRRRESDFLSTSLVAPSTINGMNSDQGNSSFEQSENHVRWKDDEAAGEYKYDSSDEAAVSCNRQHSSPIASKSSTPPKKSMMISLEYEALLQSALEDQAQHFEGEISRLQTELAASRLQDTLISDKESREIDALRKDCERLNGEVESLSSALLDLQTEESKHRATSQKLLRDQTISKDLLEKIRTDTAKEIESSDEMFEDLQMQISDLTANIRMMQQIAVDEELSQAQIFGTTGSVKENKHRGKKSRRGNRRR